MFYKCELLVGGYAYAVTEHIKNWDEITVSFKRNDYDGVVRSFTDKFEFVKGARQLLMDEYKKNYLKASANIVISTRNNSWTWTERFRCALNFSTLSDDGFVCSLNAVDDSVAAIIKARKGVQYEYSVDEVKDSRSLLYDRLEMNNNITYVLTANAEDDSTHKVMDGTGLWALPLYVEKSEVVRKNDIGTADQMDETGNGFDDLTEGSYLFKNNGNSPVSVRVTGGLSIFFNGTGSGVLAFFVVKQSAKNSISVRRIPVAEINRPGFTSIIEIEKDIVVGVGEHLNMSIANSGESSYWIKEVQRKVSIDWVSRGDDFLLDVINPNTLLNRILKSMNGGKVGLNGVIVPSVEKRLDNAMLLAAESARMMPNAKIYSSFDKFSKWMSSVFGYVYDINDKTVTFRPRKDYFKNEVVKTIEDYASYTMNVNSSLIYSQVNVGYDKQDYDSVNGKDEFRFTNEYSTGITITENKLELISPYRADAYGIEFLAQQIGEDTTDNSSDTDVFFVCVQSEGDRYILDRNDSISGVISPSTMFNVMYSPTSMIDANKAFLGGFISELSYASSEGNTAVTINGKYENRDITLDGGLFNVNEVEIETSDIEIPSDMAGVIKFEHQGEIVEGYYKSTDFNYTKNKSAKITLIVKK